MIKIIEQSFNFNCILQRGVYSSSILTKFDEQSILVSWLLENYKLPKEVDFIVHRIKDTYSGIVEINKAPCLGIKFKKQELYFCPLSTHCEISYSEWCKIWLYDTRVQASVGVLIECIKKYEKVH